MRLEALGRHLGRCSRRPPRHGAAATFAANARLAGKTNFPAKNARNGTRRNALACDSVGFFCDADRRRGHRALRRVAHFAPAE